MLIISPQAKGRYETLHHLHCNGWLWLRESTLDTVAVPGVSSNDFMMCLTPKLLLNLSKFAGSEVTALLLYIC